MNALSSYKIPIKAQCRFWLESGLDTMAHFRKTEQLRTDRLGELVGGRPQPADRSYDDDDDVGQIADRCIDLITFQK